MSAGAPCGPDGVKYYSFVEPSGYGMAAVTYVRALVNAGVRLQWVPLRREGHSAVALAPGESPAMLKQSVGDVALADLPALLAATTAPIAYDTVLVHTVPEHWPSAFEPGRRNVGYVAWETDRPPGHWKPLLESAHRVLVPCADNRDAFSRAGVKVPVLVVPHVRRHAWNEFAPDELAAARSQFGVDRAACIFYSIGAWDPRKALADLLRSFVHAFHADDAVALILKTGPIGFGAPPFYERTNVAALAQAAIDAAVAEVGRPPPNICLLPYDLNGRGIDLLHALGDGYVSLSHGEGWGLGAFDAATQAIPVLMTGWGGQRDFLGSTWPGALPYAMTQVPLWPPGKPSYWPSQRWAQVELGAAVAMLRDFAAASAPHAAAAEITAERIARRFAEPAVAHELIAALGS